MALESVFLTEETLRNSDIVIITTDHSNIDYQWVVDKARLILDTRNALKDKVYDQSKVVRL